MDDMAIGELFDQLEALAQWLDDAAPREHSTPWLIRRDLVEAMRRLARSHGEDDCMPQEVDPMPTNTYVLGVLEVNEACFCEIRATLEAAGYRHCIYQEGDDVVLDMQGIVLRRAAIREATTTVPPAQDDLPADAATVLRENLWNLYDGSTVPPAASEALEKYGQHFPLCQSNLSTRELRVPCSCGFAAVLAAVRGER